MHEYSPNSSRTPPDLSSFCPVLEGVQPLTIAEFWSASFEEIFEVRLSTGFIAIFVVRPLDEFCLVLRAWTNFHSLHSLLLEWSLIYQVGIDLCSRSVYAGCKVPFAALSLATEAAFPIRQSAASETGDDSTDNGSGARHGCSRNGWWRASPSTRWGPQNGPRCCNGG